MIFQKKFFHVTFYWTSANACFWKGGTVLLLMRFWSLPLRCMGNPPFSSVDFFIRALLLGYRSFYQEIYIRNKYYKHCCCIRPFLNVINVVLVYNPNCSFCFSPGWYWKNLVFDVILTWDLESYQMEIMTK